MKSVVGIDRDRIDSQLRPVTYRSLCDLTQSFTNSYAVETRTALVPSDREVLCCSVHRILTSGKPLLRVSERKIQIPGTLDYSWIRPAYGPSGAGSDEPSVLPM